MRSEAPVDPRGPRFSAWLTSAVLVIVLLTGFWPLLAAQAVIFGVSAFRIRANLWGALYRVALARRLGPPAEREAAEPLRFAQAVGFAFAFVGVLGYATGLTLLGTVATAFALVAALLNAAFGFCLGCHAYLLLRRISRAPSTT